MVLKFTPVTNFIKKDFLTSVKKDLSESVINEPDVKSRVFISVIDKIDVKTFDGTNKIVIEAIFNIFL